MAEGACVICLEPIIDEAVSLPCAHTFHTKCIEEWLRQKTWCPVCRTSCREDSDRMARQQVSNEPGLYDIFVNPQPTEYATVPLAFESAEHYLSVMRQNNLADFWHMLSESTSQPAIELQATRESPTGLALDHWGNEDFHRGGHARAGWNETLLKVDGRYHMVVSSCERRSQVLMLVGVHASHRSKDALLAFISQATGETPFNITEREDRRAEGKGKGKGKGGGRARRRGNRRRPLMKLFFVEVSSRYVQDTVKALKEGGIASQVKYTRWLDGEAPREISTELLVVPEMVTGKTNPRVELIGYVGNLVHQHQTIERLLTSQAPAPAVLQTLVDPSHVERGDFAGREIQTYISPEFGYAPINQPQREAVEGLETNLEIIQGPPGTGKSAMILHILRSKVPADKVTVITSVCNEAIGNVASKLKPYHQQSPLVVLGNVQRVAAAALPFTIPMQVESDPKVCFWLRFLDAIQHCHSLLVNMIVTWESCDARYDWACRYQSRMEPSESVQACNDMGLYDDIFGSGFADEQAGTDEEEDMVYSTPQAAAPSQLDEEQIESLQVWWGNVMANTSTSGIQYRRSYQEKATPESFSSRRRQGQQREACRRIADRLWRASVRARWAAWYHLRDQFQMLEKEIGNRLRVEKLRAQRQLVVNARVILCTIACTSRIHTELSGRDAHTVIIDEAGATSEPAIPLLLRLNPVNIILVGDHFQLPPSSMSKQLKVAGVNRSLMERCIAQGRSFRKLDLQYRLHPAICGMISKVFYAPKGVPLKTDREIAELRKRVDPTGTMNGAARQQCCLFWHDFEIAGDGLEQPGPGGRSWQNLREAQVCRQLYSQERERAGPPRAIHIIAMYKAQSDLLTKLFPEARQPGEAENLDPARTAPFDPLLSIGTVDAAQGTEAAVVMLSTVRANKESVLGFTSQWQRVNVALSRAQCELHIVGSASTLNSKCRIWMEIYQYVDAHGKFLYHAQQSRFDAAPAEADEGNVITEIVESNLARARSRVAQSTDRLQRAPNLGAILESNRLHNQAQQHREESQALRSTAHSASHSQADPVLAQGLTELAQEESRLARLASEQAGDLAFQARNESRNILEEIDLHGLTVAQAVACAQSTVGMHRGGSGGIVELICGWGRHSGGDARIKHAVLQELSNVSGVTCMEDPDNPGVLLLGLPAQQETPVTTAGSKKKKKKKQQQTEPIAEPSEEQDSDHGADAQSEIQSEEGDEHLSALLGSIGLEHLHEVFREHQIDHRRLVDMSDKDLQELGLKKGPRLKLRKWISEQSSQQETRQDVEENQPSTSLEHVSAAQQPPKMSKAQKRRAKKAQEEEAREAEEAAEHQLIKTQMVQRCMEMGFGEDAARKALTVTGWVSSEAALDYLLATAATEEHVAANTTACVDLSGQKPPAQKMSKAQKRRAKKAQEEEAREAEEAVQATKAIMFKQQMVEQCMAMGFGEPEARRALEATAWSGIEAALPHLLC